MAPKARGSEILLCVKVSHVCVCVRVLTHNCMNQFVSVCIFDGYESQSALAMRAEGESQATVGIQGRIQGGKDECFGGCV